MEIHGEIHAASSLAFYTTFRPADRLAGMMLIFTKAIDLLFFL